MSNNRPPETASTETARAVRRNRRDGVPVAFVCISDVDGDDPEGKRVDRNH
ncbi:MAG TPA: hypothetical protein VG142_06930 [Trebonia sp.]|jgi:hypothetical protein|nr:hypothetical protein [Trebonia sp.]